MNKLLINLKKFEKYFSNDFYLKPKTLILLFIIFATIFLYIRNVKNIKEYLQNQKDISIMIQNNMIKENIAKAQMKKLASIKTPNRVIFSKKEIKDWKKLIQLYSIVLSKGLESKDKSILYIKSLNSKALNYKNALLLQVKMNSTIIPMPSQVVTTLFLSQFGYIKSYSSDEFEIYIINKNIKKDNRDKVKEKITKNIKSYLQKKEIK